MKGRVWRSTKAAIVLWSIVLSLSAVIASGIGTVWISPAQAVAASIGSEGVEPAIATIWWHLRLPRTILAVAVGGSLAAAGVGFQGLFRNVLAEPYIIGASAGGALGAALWITAGGAISTASRWPVGPLSIAAWSGSLIVVAMVLAIGTWGRIRSTTTWLLIGVVFSSMIGSAVSAIIYLNDSRATIVLGWLLGSLSAAHWSAAAAAISTGLIGSGLLWLLSRPLDVYVLGDVPAQSLGLPLGHFRLLIIVGATLATSGAVASAGIIGFVGLVAPHIARTHVGPRHAALFPIAAMAGGTLMLWADAIARSIVAPAELPIGIVTAAVGSPLFIWLLVSASRRGVFQ